MKQQINSSSEARTSSESSYGQIVRSAALIGGSSVVNVGVRIVRTKIVAMVLGPIGFGLTGVYTSVTDMATAFASLGLESSGVRQIAAAVAMGDDVRLARAALALRRLLFVLALVGALSLCLLSQPISQVTFGDGRHRGAVAVLSLVVLLTTVAGGERALLQGMRRVVDMARMNVVAAVSGAAVSIICVCLWGERGIVPFLVATSGVGALVAWWFAHKVRVPRVTQTWAELWSEAWALLGLGLVFTSTTLMGGAVGYVTRVIIVHLVGLEGAGLYQASWTLSTLYVGFVLQAMGMDFYPRLAGAKQDSDRNRVVNEQIEIGMLLAAPGILATLTFAPLIITAFYSATFLGSVEILRWQALGVLLQVVSWPMGYVAVALGRGGVFFACEFVAHLVHCVLIWFGMLYWGLPGIGVAFFLLYCFYLCLIYAVVRRLTGFQWSAGNIRVAKVVMPATAVVAGAQWLLPSGLALIIGGAVSLACGVHSFGTVWSLLGRWVPLRLKTGS